MIEFILLIIVWLGFLISHWQGDRITKRLDRLIEILEEKKP